MELADLILVDAARSHQQPGPDAYSSIVYAARPDDVRMTMVEGEVLVDEFAPVRIDAAEAGATARREARALAARAGL